MLTDFAEKMLDTHTKYLPNFPRALTITMAMCQGTLVGTARSAAPFCRDLPDGYQVLYTDTWLIDLGRGKYEWP